MASGQAAALDIELEDVINWFDAHFGCVWLFMQLCDSSDFSLVVSHIYSVVDQAHLVSHLARHLGVGGAHLLSHDYGDSVALELLARFNLAPEGREGGQSGGHREGNDATPTPLLTLQSLTMLNGGVFPETNIPRPLQKGWVRWRSFLVMVVVVVRVVVVVGRVVVVVRVVVVMVVVVVVVRVVMMAVVVVVKVLVVRVAVVVRVVVVVVVVRVVVVMLIPVLCSVCQVLLIPVLGPVLSRLTCRPLFRLGFGEIFGRNKPTEEEYLDFYSAIVHHSGHHVTASLLQYIPERQRNKDRWVGALRNSRVPVLMIYGPADPVNPSPHFPDMFRREAPQHSLVILDEAVGHYPQWEDPDSTLQHLTHFLDHLTPP
ncbi:hypothetical protein ACOMHN_010047 [Nucella lapillus]